MTARNRILILGSGVVSAAIALRLSQLGNVEVVDTFTPDDLARTRIDLDERTTVQQAMAAEPKKQRDAWKQANLRAMDIAGTPFLRSDSGKQKAQWKSERRSRK